MRSAVAKSPAHRVGIRRPSPCPAPPDERSDQREHASDNSNEPDEKGGPMLFAVNRKPTGAGFADAERVREDLALGAATDRKTRNKSSFVRINGETRIW